MFSGLLFLHMTPGPHTGQWITQCHTLLYRQRSIPTLEWGMLDVLNSYIDLWISNIHIYLCLLIQHITIPVLMLDSNVCFSNEITITEAFSVVYKIHSEMQTLLTKERKTFVFGFLPIVWWFMSSSSHVDLSATVSCCCCGFSVFCYNDFLGQTFDVTVHQHLEAFLPGPVQLTGRFNA